MLSINVVVVDDDDIVVVVVCSFVFCLFFFYFGKSRCYKMGKGVVCEYIQTSSVCMKVVTCDN